MVDKFQRVEIMELLQYEGGAALQMGQVTFRSIQSHSATVLDTLKAIITISKGVRAQKTAPSLPSSIGQNQSGRSAVLVFIALRRIGPRVHPS